uniref:Uncharacterized protein n=1 Tax=Oryza sativa subsp. japonica TaxID=39947 RepID=Q6Z3R5_ORYSJ|nr:hypothetical protein [Oryza sativa Japonica Group]
MHAPSVSLDGYRVALSTVAVATCQLGGKRRSGRAARGWRAPGDQIRGGVASELRAAGSAGGVADAASDSPWRGLVSSRRAEEEEGSGEETEHSDEEMARRRPRWLSLTTRSFLAIAAPL